MLEFIFGAAKSGKTTRVFDKIKKLCITKECEAESSEAQCNEKAEIFYLVPEQYALEAETQLFSFLGGSLFRFVKVTSFTRLAREIFLSYGEVSRSYADDCAKAVLVSRAAEQVAAELKIYKKAAGSFRIAFAQTLLQTISEFKNAAVSPNDLYDAADKLEDCYLKEKLLEIALIYEVYDALLAASYVDPLDDLTRAVSLEAGKGYFKDSKIFLDEFKGFTNAQLNMIGNMLKEAGSVLVTLTNRNACGSERINGDGDDTSPFAFIHTTYTSLLRQARRVNSAVSVPIELTDSHYESGELVLLEKAVFSRGKAVEYGKKPQDVFGVICKNEYDEVDFALSTICRLVRHEGLCYRDIAIVARDISVYSPIFKTACDKYEIPFYDDCVDNVFHKPLIRFVCSLIDCVVDGMSCENVLSFLKCDMTGFSLEEISQLENYAYIWNIGKKQWKTPFTAHPRGFYEEQSDDDRETLATVNRIREFVYSSITRFKEEIKSAGGNKICGALFESVERVGAREKLQAQIKELLASGEFEAAKDYERVWNIFFELLTSLKSALGDAPLDLKWFRELFLLTAKTYDMGTLPASLDTVFIGSADRMRTSQKKAVIILGVNENVFPPSPTASGVFTQRERKRLSEIELASALPVLDKIKEERFIAYKTITSPLKKLYMTARRADISGAMMTPSTIFSDIGRVFKSGFLKESRDFPPEYYCPTKKAAFARLALLWSENTPFTSALKAELSKDAFYALKIKRLEKADKKEDFALESRENATALFGSEMYISPTRVEGYYRCGFRYFCEHGLRVLPLRRAELDPMETGTLIHRILYVAAKELDLTREFDENQAKAVIKAELDRYLGEVMGGSETKTKRFLYLYQRMRLSLLKLIKQLHAELSQSEFSPCDFEYDISNNSEITPLELYGGDGTKIYVSGKIDRIDSYVNKNGEKYIRIIDYKSGKKEFALNDVLYGLNLQMLIYLHCIEKNGKGKYEHALPAGILYMPAFEKQAELSRNDDIEKASEQLLKAYRMNGLLLCEPEVLHAMESPLKGIFIPVAEKDDSTFSAKSAASLVTLSVLGKINGYIESLIVRMSDELHNGNIAALPFDDSCTYCNYNGVCGKTESDKKTPYVKLAQNAEVVDAMELSMKAPPTKDEKQGNKL